MKSKPKSKLIVLVLLVFTFTAVITYGQTCGDSNEDGSVDIVDALLIAQCYVSIVSCPSADLGDVNCDGVIDIVDALLLAQYYVGLLANLSCCEETSEPTPDPTPDPTPGEDITLEMQAEDATWSSGGVDTNHDGYTGTGFVNTDNAANEWIEWAVTVADACNATCVFRYASGGGARPIDLAINGVDAASLGFADSTEWNDWQTETAYVILSAGTNAIRLTATGSGGAPNMDKMDITIHGGEVVTPEPTEAPTPEPTRDPNETPPPMGEPMGWVTEGDGITGGGDAEPILVTSNSQLNSEAGGSTPKVIYVQGNIGGSVSVGSNKTIIGLPGAQIKNVAFGSARNVIFQNMIVKGGTDTVNTGGARNIWVDHCELSDGSDGVFDMTSATDLITVSYTFFYYDRGGDHKCCVLVGNKDSATGDRGHNRVTFYKCWWGRGVSERMPRVRFGDVHVLNCLYTCVGNVYCIAPGVEANVRAEHNIFIDVNTALAADWYNSTDSATLAEIGNAFLGSTTGTVGKYGDPVFVPPYDYVAEPPDANLEADVRANAGQTLDVVWPPN